MVAGLAIRLARLHGAGPQHKSRASDDPEPVERGKIEAALDVVSSDCSYEVWLNVAAALHERSAKPASSCSTAGRPRPRKP